MTLKTILIATAGWTLFAIMVSVALISYIVAHPLAGVSAEKRAQMLGSGVGIFVSIGYAVIWLPYAYKVGKKRREAREAAMRQKKAARRSRPRSD